MNEYWSLVTWHLVVLVTLVSSLSVLYFLSFGLVDCEPKEILIGLGCLVVTIFSGCWLYVYG